MILIGTQKLTSVYHQNSPIKEIWLGTNKVFSKSQPGDIWVYWDRGAVDGIVWEGNSLTRSGYNVRNYTNIQTSYLYNYVMGGSSTYAYNGHFVTASAIHVPQNARTLCCKVFCGTDGYGFNDADSIKIGFINKNVTSVSGNFESVASGNCSTSTYAGEINAKTISGDCTAYAGSDNYKLMIYTNQKPRSGSSDRRQIYFNKVWFE